MIKELIQKLAESGSELYAKIAEVTAVDVEAKTCDVKPIDGTSEIFDVFLNLDESTGQFREPVIGGLICIVFVTKETAVAVNYSELKQHNVKIKETELLINRSGIVLKNGKISVEITTTGILIEAANQPIQINSGNSYLAINENGIDLKSDKSISLNGGFEALYNKTPGVPITDVSQIGNSKTVKIG